MMDGKGQVLNKYTDYIKIFQLQK